MRLIKNETFRFFSLGFAAGAVLVFTGMQTSMPTPSLVPTAHAQAIR